MTKAAGQLSTRAAKSLAAMRAAITRADDARSDDAHQVRATNVVDAAQTAATDHLAAADAWETRWRPTRRHRRATAGAGPHWPIAPGTAGRAKRRRRGSVRRRGRRPALVHGATRQGWSKGSDDAVMS